MAEPKEAFKASSKSLTLSYQSDHPSPCHDPQKSLHEERGWIVMPTPLFLPYDLVTVGEKATRHKKSWLLDVNTGEQRAASFSLSLIYSCTQALLSCPPQVKHCFIPRRDAEQTNRRSKSPTPFPATFPSAHFCAPSPLPFPMPFAGSRVGTPAVSTANAALQM